MSCAVHRKIFNSIPGSSSSPPYSHDKQKMSPDIAKCPLEVKITLGEPWSWNLHVVLRSFNFSFMRSTDIY